MEVPEVPSAGASSCKDTSSFSQVVFPNITDYFAPGEDVEVTYVLSETLQTSSRDWLGLFKVGWTSTREYYTYVWAPKVSDHNSGDRTVSALFGKYYLPKDNDEFYQFCYVTKQGQVRGASTPFQFRDSNESDLVEVEDESGMVMLKTKSAVLEECLQKLTADKADLEKRISELSEANAKLEGSMQSSSAELSALRKELRKKENECEQLNTRITATIERLDKVKLCLKNAEDKLGKQKTLLKDANENISQLEKDKSVLNAKLLEQEDKNKAEVAGLVEHLDAKSTQVSEMEAAIIDMEKDLEEKKVEELARKSELVRHIDVAKAQTEQCKEEIVLYRAQLAQSEESRQDVMQKLTTSRNKITELEGDVQRKASKILAYEEKSKILKRELRECEKQLVVEKGALEKQVSNLEDKLNACEASKRLISSELTETRDRRDKLMSELIQTKKARDQLTRDLEASRRQLSELEKNYLEIREQATRGEQRIIEKEKKLASEKVDAKQRETTLQNQVKLLRHQLECADKAVAAAASVQDGTETNNSGTQTKTRSAQKIEDDKDSVIADLKMQIEDLRTRLSMGAAAYTEKYKECHKLERKMKKIQHTKSAPKAESKNTEESATASSQDESTRKSSGAKPKVPAKQQPEQEDASTSGNLMSKLEHFFMAIADPDVEEKERANNLKLQLEELEKNVQFQHGRYKKYKQLYLEEKETNGADMKMATEQIQSLTSEIEEMKKAKESLQHENDALKQQLLEFVKNSKDENVLKTREIVIPTASGVKSISRTRYPHEDVQLDSSYPHDSSDTSKDSSSDNDITGEFHLANTRFTSGLALCPEKQADISEPVNIPRSRDSVLAPSSSVIKRQPARSPPMIEIISSGSEEITVTDSSSSPVKTRPASKKSSRGRKSRGNRKHHKIA